jgi:hypothetical protein
MDKGGGEPLFIVPGGNLPIGVLEDRTSLINLSRNRYPGLVWSTEQVWWGTEQIR